MSSSRSLELGHSEVQNFHSPVERQKQIFGFKIAMNNFSLVRGSQAMCDLQGVIRGLCHGKPAFFQALRPPSR